MIASKLVDVPIMVVFHWIVLMEKSAWGGALTWPAQPRDQTGGLGLAERAPCTLGGVKSIRALIEGGGRHNLLSLWTHRRTKFA